MAKTIFRFKCSTRQFYFSSNDISTVSWYDDVIKPLTSTMVDHYIYARFNVACTITRAYFGVSGLILLNNSFSLRANCAYADSPQRTWQRFVRMFVRFEHHK